MRKNIICILLKTIPIFIVASAALLVNTQIVRYLKMMLWQIVYDMPTFAGVGSIFLFCEHLGSIALYMYVIAAYMIRLCKKYGVPYQSGLNGK